MTLNPNHDAMNTLGRAESVTALSQLDLAARAKLPLAPTLRAMAAEAHSRKLRQTLSNVAARLELGESLPDALASVKSKLTPTLRVLTAGGTQIGRLDALLHWTVEQTRRTIELRRQVWMALAYPVVLLSIATLIGSFVLFTIVPQFGKIFEDFGTEINPLTLMVISAARFGMNHWLQCLLAGGLFLFVCFSLLLWRGTWLVTRQWSGVIPLIGPLFRLASLAEFCHLLGVFVETGQPLAQGVRAAGEASDDEWLRNASRLLADDIERGFDAEMAAVTCGLPASLAHVLRESSSPETLAEALHGVGDIYSARTEVSSRLMATVIEPFVMIFTVVGLGTIVIALFLPLIRLLNDLS